MRRHLGFTGTRAIPGSPKAVQERRDRLFALMKEFWEAGFSVFHHGDCIGADELAHQIACKLNFHIVVHPPNNSRNRAFCGKCDEESGESDSVWWMPKKPYLSRNRDIVDQSNVLIAMPNDPMREELRSGTWSTIRYARKEGVLIRLV